jgi:ribosomal protein S18 acetylase RimI-like enzyme
MRDAQIQSYIRFAASRLRDTERIGPFLATFSHHSDNPFLNYAIPDDGATPTAEEVAALIVAYQQRNRLPRLEYMPGLAPALEAILLAAGFTVEDRFPLMVCTPGAERDVPAPPGIELLATASDDEILEAVTVQSDVFGDPPPSPEDVTGRRATIQVGGRSMVARVRATGEPVGAAMYDVPADHTTELAGVAVLLGFRRRGIAGALTARLTRDAFAAGITTVFLTPGGAEAERVYARAGFSTSSQVVHISKKG